MRCVQEVLAVWAALRAMGLAEGDAQADITVCGKNEGEFLLAPKRVRAPGAATDDELSQPLRALEEFRDPRRHCPHSEGAGQPAGQLAGSVAGRLAAVLDGTTWPPNAAHTDIVAVAGQSEHPDSGHRPDVDVLTDRAAVVFQDRPVVAATTSLTDLLQNSFGAGRELQIVTPPSTRLTFAVRNLLSALPARWVVRDADGGFHDGLRGVQLHWYDGRFAPVWNGGDGPRLADSFTAPAPEAMGERQMLLTIHTTHSADEHLLLGGALEAGWQLLTGRMVHC